MKRNAKRIGFPQRDIHGASIPYPGDLARSYRSRTLGTLSFSIWQRTHVGATVIHVSQSGNVMATITGLHLSPRECSKVKAGNLILSKLSATADVKAVDLPARPIAPDRARSRPRARRGLRRGTTTRRATTSSPFKVIHDRAAGPVSRGIPATHRRKKSLEPRVSKRTRSARVSERPSPRRRPSPLRPGKHGGATALPRHVYSYPSAC